MTLPSIPQLFTSTVFPTKDVETLLEPVAKAGIPSAAVVNNAWIPLWLSQGKHAEPPGTFDVMISGDLDAKAITDRAIGWLDRHRDDRFVLYLHYLDAHTPYSPPKDKIALFADPAYAGQIGDTFKDAENASGATYDAADHEKVVALYDAAVRYIDEQIGRLVDTLARQGDLEHTVIVVAADHGEEFWDHGHFFHGQTLYDELLHIPLVVRAPGAAPAGTVIQRPVRMIDVAPSLVEWAHLERPADLRGPPAVAGPRRTRCTGRRPDRDRDAGAVPDPLRAAHRRPEADREPRHRQDASCTRSRAIPTSARTSPPSAPTTSPRSDRASQRRARCCASAATSSRSSARSPARRRSRCGCSSEPRSGTFLTLDRTSPFGEPRLALSPDGANLTAQADVDARGTGFRFDRLLSPRNLAARRQAQDRGPGRRRAGRTERARARQGRHGAGRRGRRHHRRGPGQRRRAGLRGARAAACASAPGAFPARRSPRCPRSRIRRSARSCARWAICNDARPRPGVPRAPRTGRRRPRPGLRAACGSRTRRAPAPAPGCAG